MKLYISIHKTQVSFYRANLYGAALTSDVVVNINIQELSEINNDLVLDWILVDDALFDF